MHIGTEEHEKNTIAPACVTWIKNYLANAS